MSDVTNNQNQNAADDYFGGGSYTLKPKVNHGVKVKSWSVESNEREGKTSYYLKLVYVHPQPEVEEANWSTMNELINFPGPKQGATEVTKDSVRYGFVNPLRGFLTNFMSDDEFKDVFRNNFAKLGIKDFTFSDLDTLNDELKQLVTDAFAVAEGKGLFNMEGVLICGYGNPVEKDGETKQYLAPAKYGRSGCYKPPFRTNMSEELPAEKTTGFSSDSDKKYNFWSYTRTATTSASNDQTQEPAAEVNTSGW